MKTNNVDVGKDALNLFVVAPARFTHEDDGCTTLKNNACYVVLDDAIDFARETNKAAEHSYTVYRLEPIYTASKY
jgi:hypothetical protein